MSWLFALPDTFNIAPRIGWKMFLLLIFLAFLCNIGLSQINNFTAYSDGTAVAFTGFPMRLIVPITSKAYVASSLTTRNQLIIDKNAWPGVSGGPVYLADGTVIGILVSTGVNLGAGLTFAQPSESVMDFLRENKIAFSEKPENQKRKKAGKHQTKRRIPTKSR